MTIVHYLLRARLRGRWQGILALSVVAGLATGAVIASASGARRTETAYDRLSVASRAAALIVSTDAGGYDPVRRIEGVEAVAALAGFELYPVGSYAGTDVITRASVDGAFGYQVEKPNLVEGRMPRRDRADEILVNPAFAAAFAVGAGDQMTLVAQDLWSYLAELSPDAATPTFEVTITGVGVSMAEVVPTTDLDGLPGTFVTPAMFERLVEAEVHEAFTGVAVVLGADADVASVIDEIEQLFGAESVFLLDVSKTQETVERALRPQGTALWAFTLVLFLVAAMVVGQAVTRHASQGAAEDGSLDALGVGRRQVVGVAALEGMILGILAAAVAVVVTTAASSAFPVGRARLAEPKPGVVLNVAFVVAGVFGVIALATLAAALAAAKAERSASVPRPVQRPSTLAGVAAAMGAGPRFVLGLRRAFEASGGAAAVPVRSGLVGAILAVGAVMAAATFAASLDALVTTPDRYGQTWTTSIDAQFGAVPSADLVDRYGDDRSVAGMAGINYGVMQMAGVAVPVITFHRLAGELDLNMLEGRPPARVGEIALGSLTLSEVGASVGDDITVRTHDGTERWRVVGRTVFPQISLGSFNALGLGTGGVVAAEAVPSPYEPAEIAEALADGDIAGDWRAADFFIDGRSYDAVVLRAQAGAEAHLIERVAEDPASITGFHRILQRPAAVSTYADVRGTLVALAVVLAGLASALIGHVLVTSVRRRQGEMATCRALGMRGRDVASVVRWQATSLAVAAVLGGVPLGIALGRVAWTWFADDLGVQATPTTPWGLLTAAVLGAVLVANAAGTISTSRARHLRPAAVLRSE